MLATFVLLGHWFEMRSRRGANDAIRELLDLAPAMAVVLRDGEPVEVPTAEVVVGDLLLIRPGAKLPVDAVVEQGESQVDESAVTGESLPVHKAPGDQLIGATINKNGVLRTRQLRASDWLTVPRSAGVRRRGPRRKCCRATRPPRSPAPRSAVSARRT